MEAAALLVAFTAVLVALACLHFRRHAMASAPVNRQLPVAGGALPLLGNLVPIARNLHRIYDWMADQNAGFAGKTWVRCA